MVRIPVLLLLLVLAACGEEDESCGMVGAGCSSPEQCGDELICQNDAFCAPDRPTCGGFAGAECTGADELCLNLDGADFGVCVTASERDCICARSRDHVDGC